MRAGPSRDRPRRLAAGSPRARQRRVRRSAGAPPRSARAGPRAPGRGPPPPRAGPAAARGAPRAPARSPRHPSGGLLHQHGADEAVEIAVEDCVDVADLELGPVVLDSLRGMQRVGADLAAELDLALLAAKL